tara:strand:- start:1466 stop:2167 length:702 start_codon:yes stop_codon:yes gene_type:complete
MDKLEVFINLDYQKISLIIIDIKNKKKIKFTEFEVLNDFNNIDTILDNLNKILKGLIIDLEKEINYTINSINLMIDSPLNLYINLSVKKNFDQTEIQKNQLEYLIQDLKQQILRNNRQFIIGHILLKNFFLNGAHHSQMPIGKVCKDLILEAQFVCFSTKIIEPLKNFFGKHQIKINKIICTKYARTLLDDDSDNLTEAATRAFLGSNINEVEINQKKSTKLGFFERIFHIFS